MKKQRGITLLALVITVIIIIILATVAINFLFGENGLITRTQQAAQMSDIENVREKLEMAKGTAVIDGKGYIDPDHYFDIIYEEGIIGDRENDVTDNGNGTYEITTTEGYIFIITLLPTPEEAKDIDIEYSGTSEGPRIVSIKADGTTNSISIEVEARNAERATYTYEYSISGEEKWQEAEQSKNNTCTINNLTEGETYDIRVTVTTNDGSVTRKTSVHLGELPEGTITFKSEWVGDGTARVTINTSAEGYRLQYQINAIEENGWIDIDNGVTVSNLTYPSTVYARIFDGTNGSEEASETLEDKTAPQVTVESNGTTSNSVSVSATSTDAQSGMKESPTYTYSIKVTGQADSTYTTPSTADAIASNSYTFTGLTQGTNYTVRVQVNGDKADNVGTGTLSDLTTASIPSGEGDSELEEGAITFGETAWSNNKASITVNTSTSYRIEYQVNTLTEGNWTEIANGGTIDNLNYQDTVYARLTDGNNHGDYASVSIDDKTVPQVATIDLSSTNVTTGTNVTATVTHIDNESGPNIAQCKYVWNTSSANLGEDASLYTDGTFSSNGQQISRTMSTSGTWYLHVLTVDNAGNATETVSNAITAMQLVTSISVSPSSVTLEEGQTRQLSVTVNPSTADNRSVTWSSNNNTVASVSTSGLVTAKTVGSATITATAKDGSGVAGTCRVTVETAGPTIEDILEEGDWVRYPSRQGNMDCVVLYDSSSNYGVEIITMETVEEVTLGDNNDFTSAVNAYNNSKNILNSRASSYNNSIYSARARSVGCNPNNINGTNEWYTREEEWFSEKYEGMFKDNDSSSDIDDIDHDQISMLDIVDIDDDYWMATRSINTNTGYNHFNVDYIVKYSDGDVRYRNATLVSVYSDDGPRMSAITHGLRPVFKLKSNIKVTGGNGTSSSPYTLGT